MADHRVIAESEIGRHKQQLVFPALRLSSSATQSCGGSTGTASCATPSPCPQNPCFARVLDSVCDGRLATSILSQFDRKGMVVMNLYLVKVDEVTKKHSESFEEAKG